MTAPRTEWTTRPLGPGDAAEAVAVIHEAFAAQPIRTDPPPGALRETVDTVREAISCGGGACVPEGASLIGVVLWAAQADGLYFGRLAIRPGYAGRGAGRALVDAAEMEARRRGLARVHLGARLSLPGNRAFFAACGYREAGVATHAGYDAPTSMVMEKLLRA